MKRSFHFSNYRIFADQQNMTLAPVTVIFGKNNVGKSALLKLPVMINSILTYKGEGELFAKSSDGLRICENYRDVVYGKGSRAVTLEIKTDGASASVKFFVEPSGTPRTHIEDFKGVLYDGTAIGDFGQLSDIFCFDIEYLKAIRDYPKEGYFSMTPAENEATTGGLFAYRRLVDDILNHDGRLLNEVSRWYSDTFDGWNIEVDASRDPIYSLTLRHGNISGNLIDGGAGIAQSLPVIVSAATDTDTPKLLIYEEPETHLHPEAHGEMAQFIARQAIKSKGNKTFLIESHSLNFIIRLRALVASGKLPTEALALYYAEFDPTGHKSTLRKVTVNPDGTVEGWPDKVFKETLEETMALRRAQLKREEAPGL